MPMIDHVVTVVAARTGLQVRREIDMADAEPGELIGDRGDVVERRSRMHLHAVRRPKVRHGSG
jgi:hypothetical protein